MRMLYTDINAKARLPNLFYFISGRSPIIDRLEIKKDYLDLFLMNRFEGDVKMPLPANSKNFVIRAHILVYGKVFESLKPF